MQRFLFNDLPVDLEKWPEGNKDKYVQYRKSDLVMLKRILTSQ